MERPPRATNCWQRNKISFSTLFPLSLVYPTS
jgi:hypothetical protein